MSTHFNKLSPAEDERLALLLEEMGEAIQIIGKVQRHGYESVNPDSESRLTNRDLLAKELGDVIAAMDLIAQDVGDEEMERARQEKLGKVGRWLHHQPKAKP